jgi:hypothetical protein
VVRTRKTVGFAPKNSALKVLNLVLAGKLEFLVLNLCGCAHSWGKLQAGNAAAKG